MGGLPKDHPSPDQDKNIESWVVIVIPAFLAAGMANGAIGVELPFTKIGLMRS